MRETRPLASRLAAHDTVTERMRVTSALPCGRAFSRSSHASSETFAVVGISHRIVPRTALAPPRHVDESAPPARTPTSARLLHVSTTPTAGGSRRGWTRGWSPCAPASCARLPGWFPFGSPHQLPITRRRHLPRATEATCHRGARTRTRHHGVVRGGRLFES